MESNINYEKLYFEKLKIPVSKNVFFPNIEPYITFQNKLNQEIDIIINPPKVAPGEPCPRCGSKKTFQCTAQTSSGDEAPSIYLHCYSCNENVRLKN